jgi:capsular polysaccharide biosynthesis protein
MIMMVVLALALGIVGAFIAESVDHRVYIPREVEEKLKLPVFASVTKTD